MDIGKLMLLAALNPLGWIVSIFVFLLALFFTGSLFAALVLTVLFWPLLGYILAQLTNN